MRPLVGHHTMGSIALGEEMVQGATLGWGRSEAICLTVPGYQGHPISSFSEPCFLYKKELGRLGCWGSVGLSFPLEDSGLCKELPSCPRQPAQDDVGLLYCLQSEKPCKNAIGRLTLSCPLPTARVASVSKPSPLSMERHAREHKT